MAAIVRQGVLLYRYILELRDPRTESFLLCGSPFPLIGLLVAYWFFVFRIGPKFMEHRKPFNLDRIIQIYNAAQVILCTYLFYKALTLTYGLGPYNWACEPVDFSTDPEPALIARCVHYYFLMKVLDLMDTVFFVLRKKQCQVTFLHTYHHMGMAAMTWLGVVFLPGGQGVFLGFINTFVHSVMYSYYFITIWRPEYKKNIWWKKYITQLQLLQFLLLALHNLALLLSPPCGYPKWIALFVMPQFTFFFMLFGDFYRKTYK